jgi:hypothetical protein
MKKVIRFLFKCIIFLPILVVSILEAFYEEYIRKFFDNE